ncbi:hypothetical protein NH340_JMT03709 [Sarcoptes scabiei]|nr:hypothetical protein NH340_JMT03709 [Sarcoptes scabiei]
MNSSRDSQTLNQEEILGDELEKIDNFFHQLQEPKNLAEIRRFTEEFCRKNFNRKIVLITSGGTTVPMEQNTVRYIDNFSAGTRGSASTEYFFDSGEYAIIFFYRHKSLEPFVRHFDNLLYQLRYDEKSDNFDVPSNIKPKLKKMLEKISDSSESLLKITFTTLSEYLYILRELTAILKQFGSKAMLYLAAAVSDFYIPPQNLAVHKIQSDSPLRLHFEMVPKILRPLVKFWVPDAFVISFKLETDANILMAKAKKALSRYGHRLVIANELNTRKWKVILVGENDSEVIEINSNITNTGTSASNQSSIEIEKLIVSNVIRRHDDFIRQSASKCSRPTSQS